MVSLAEKPTTSCRQRGRRRLVAGIEGRDSLAGYFFLLAACFAATACCFFCMAPLALTCFCDACLFTDFGDLSPMMFIFRSMVYSPAALSVSPKGTLRCLFVEGFANTYIQVLESFDPEANRFQFSSLFMPKW